MIIAAFGDLHAPFIDQKAVDKALDIIKADQPRFVVQMGDAYDFYSWSQHSPSRSVSPSWELTEGRCQMEAFWASVKSVAPMAKCYQLLGNHDLRMSKKISKTLPEFEAVLEALDFWSLWRFKDVETIPYREPLELGNVVLHHGYGKLGSHMAGFNRSTIVGHLHRGDVTYRNLWGSTIWELNAGFLGDKKSLAFAYTPTKLANWTTGLGIVDEMGPRFVPL